MAPGISYDDSGSLANYFGVTFLALILVPSTYFILRPERKQSLRPLVSAPLWNKGHNSADRKSVKRRGKFLRRAVPLFAAWLFFGYLCYGIYVAPSAPGETIYNPFEVLGIAGSSDERQIKKHYKKLSLQYHPDKVQLSENQTKEDADAKFVELTKAYKSLTDEVTRENLAKYGNPDGPQQREDKIAIPKWVVEGKNSAWLLAAYGLVLGGVIPWIVGRWWFSTRRLTRDGILNPTAEAFFHGLREDSDFSALISILASALELQPILAGKTRGAKKERKERQAKVEELEKRVDARKAELDIEEDPFMKTESKVGVTTAAARRARALLWAHLLRLDMHEEDMRTESEAVLLAIQPLLSGLLNIALAQKWLKTSLLCIKLQPSLVQALPTDIPALAQFPGISAEEAIEMEITSGAEGKQWLEKWVKSDPKGHNEAKEIASVWPRLDIVSAEYKVSGEKVVSPSSIVQLTFKCRYIYPTAKPVPSKPVPNGHLSSESEKIDADAESKDARHDALSNGTAQSTEEKVQAATEEIKAKAEEVTDSIVANAEKKSAEVAQKGKPPSASTVIVPPNGFAHAPNWPKLRKPHYYVLLGDSKIDRVIVPPIRITDIPLPRADGLPSEPKEFILQFQAPPQPNLYSFVAHWRSDTFLGADVHIPMMLKVEEPVEGASDDEDDISEPDEDTLAGQMAMMRGGKVKASAVHDDDDDEDGSEYESSSDEEGPRKGKAINEDSDSDSD